MGVVHELYQFFSGVSSSNRKSHFRHRLNEVGAAKFASKTQLLELEIADWMGKRAVKIHLNIHENSIFSAFFGSPRDINHQPINH